MYKSKNNRKTDDFPVSVFLIKNMVQVVHGKKRRKNVHVIWPYQLSKNASTVSLNEKLKFKNHLLL